jgi:UTP--glucose-1-phosphate uridylyltransferase
MKGVIVAAGYGTRFLPVTKTIPKEMIPLINKPSIAFVVEEFIASGIKDIIIITSRRKKALDDYFDREVEMESVFTSQGAEQKLEKIEPYEARFYFVRQQVMYGAGHALLQIKALVGDEPLIVAYPDDIHFGEPPLAKQLIDMYEETGCSVLATLHDPPNINRYGVLELADDNLHVLGIEEKPPKGKEKSKEASIGRYLYAPGYLDYLEEGWRNHDPSQGEFYHTYGVQRQIEDGKVVFKQVEGERLDIGEPGGFLQAIIRYASQDPELRPILEQELQRLQRGM